MKGLLLMDPSALPLVFDAESRIRLTELVEFDRFEAVTSFDGIEESTLREVEVLVTGWGVPAIGLAEAERMPRLRAIVHWGGGVGFVAPEVAESGIAISSARAANAIPVAEFSVAMIVLAAKRAFWVSRQYASEQRLVNREIEMSDAGLYNTTVGIVGASTIGELTMEMLKSYDVEVLLHHPRATPERAKRLGAELVDDLVEVARRSSILSVHAPDIAATRGMISRAVLAALPDGATVINTARGRLIDQDALVEELESGRLYAVLDVTEPDVLPTGHPLYTLPNVFLTPHLAGSLGVELHRLGASAVEEIARLAAGDPFQHSIAPQL